MTDPTPASPIPNQRHRLACDRALRLAHHQGAVEVLAFYDQLTPGERRIAFALLARLAGRRHLEPLGALEESPWWTTAELRLAHSLWVHGHRSEWIDAGHRLYMRDLRALQRDVPRAATSQHQPTVDLRRTPAVAPLPPKTPWSAEDDAFLLGHPHAPAADLALRLGRSVSAIRSRRRDLKRRADAQQAAS